MAKLVFPGVGAPYRGFIGEARGWFNRIASFIEQSPSAAASVNSQIAVLAAKTGLPTADTATKTVVSTGQTFAGVTGTGTTATITVSGGAITAIALTA